MLALRNYEWAGNIRELRNAVERAAILCPGGFVGPEDLPQTIAPNAPSVKLGDSVALAVIEENHIRRVMASSKSLQEAAETLATLWRKRKIYGI